MAIIDTVRTLIRDSGSARRFTDAELGRVIDFAIDEINAWAGTAYTLSQYEERSIEAKYTQLMLLVCKIWAMQMDIQDVARYVKFVTQDVQYDPSDIATRMNRGLTMAQKDLEFKIRKWIGIDVSAVAAVPTEYTEL